MLEYQLQLGPFPRLKSQLKLVLTPSSEILIYGSRLLNSKVFTGTAFDGLLEDQNRGGESDTEKKNGMQRKRDRRLM